MKLSLRFPCGALYLYSYASCILLPHVILAQKCYYPNGDISTSDYPCSSEVEGLCCPLNWQCLSNGLCYLDNAQYYGRYTCTDQTWSSPGCPEFCTDGNSDAGDQALLQCSNHGNNWCCDHNRNASNVCCDSTNSNDFFPLPKGTSVASISTTGPAVASAAIIGNHGNVDTTSSATSSTTTSISSTSTSSTSTSSSTSTTTSSTKNAGGAAAHTSPTTFISSSSVVSVITSPANGGLITTTNIIIQTVSPASPPPPSSSSSSSSNHLGAEVGGAVAGAVLLIALIALAFFLLHRRKKKRQQQQQRYQAAPTADLRKSLDYMYKPNEMMNSPHTADGSPEIDGTPIVGVYRGWPSPPGHERALRVVNGSERQSMVSGVTAGDSSHPSELESPAKGAFSRNPQPPAIAELAGERER